ncbi:MAG: DUF2975 domain-containing protein [FCB group bacterium]|nr:DUF2975 domain-containing protein [FCB group bacterium]
MSRNNTADSRKSVKLVGIVIQIFWYLGWMAVAMQLALLALVSFTDFHIKYIQLPIEVSFQTTSGEQIASSLTSSASMPIVGFSDPVVEAEMMADYQGLVLMIPTLLLAGYMTIVLQLRRFIKTVRGGDPFSPDNPKRLRLIGWLVTLGAPVVGILNQIYGRVFIHLVDVPGATLEVNKDIYPFVIFAGLLILIIARVFEVGVKIQEDQKLTI